MRRPVAGRIDGKRLAAPARLCASGMAVIVEGELLLVALIFRPLDIALVRGLCR